MYKYAKYNPIFLNQRVFAVQDRYIDGTEGLEKVSLSPIAVFDREGIIAGTNTRFRNLTGITEEDIKNSTANIYNCLTKENEKIKEYIRDAFDGKQTICAGDESLLIAKDDCPEKHQLRIYTVAILFPMTRDDVKLVGIMLDEDETDDMGSST